MNNAYLIAGMAVMALMTLPALKKGKLGRWQGVSLLLSSGPLMLVPP